MDTKGSSDRKLLLTASGDREIVMTRKVAAPRRLVWDAWTKADQVPHWFTGPSGWTMPVCRIDLRVGGAWRYVLHGKEGRKMGMRGVYREVSAPDRLVLPSTMDDGEDDSAKGATDIVPEGSVSTLTLVEEG